MEGKKLRPVNQFSDDVRNTTIQKLQNVLPEVFTEGEMVDFDKLKEILTGKLDANIDKYSFNWNGKKRSIKLSQSPTVATLKPNPSKSKKFDDTNNLYIEGDNLDVLKILQRSYAGRVKMIYLDPPYNTGREFVYNDDYQETEEDYLQESGQMDNLGERYSTNKETDGRFHTKWLNMMYSRLKVAREYLRDDGVIFLSIDDNEFANLRKVMDELYGANNFVETLIWKKRATAPNDRSIGRNHEYILVYAKDIDKIELGLLPRDEKSLSRYKNPDDDPRGPWVASDLSVNGKGGRLAQSTVYPIVNPETSAEFWPLEGKGWIFGKEKMVSFIEEGRVGFRSGSGAPFLKRYLSEVRQGVTMPTILSNFGFSQDSTKEVKKLFGYDAFDYPKPTKLIKALIQVGTTSDDDIIMDFFSGSATTAEAVMRLNSENGTHLKFIMVQLQEKVNEGSAAFSHGFRTIPEVAEERICRAGDKIVEENPLLADKLDIGFKVFELSKSNIKKWNAEPKDLNEQFELLANNFEEGSKSIDVVYEIMLKQGLDLTYPISEIKVGDAVVYDIAFGAMFVVLGDKITSEVAGHIMKQIADEEAENSVVVLQDEKFINDSEKLNTIEQLNASGIQYNDILSI